MKRVVFQGQIATITGTRIPGPMLGYLGVAMMIFTTFIVPDGLDYQDLAYLLEQARSFFAQMI